jgi:hypothetical protein
LLVSKPKFLSMASPITSGRDNCFANLEDIYKREELVREEQKAALWLHMDERFEAIGTQIKARMT